MDILEISKVLGTLIENYYISIRNDNRDCRLIIPGITKAISQQVHGLLLKKNINSYLIIGNDEEPDETKHLIRAVGLTSKRIGSFVAVVSPGQLSSIQDSIRGSGGAVRSIAFSEEWPWIDTGSEHFNFKESFIGKLIDEWTSDESEKGWLHDFIINALLPSTQSSARRAYILLEEILGTFEPNLYPEILDIRKKMLYHSGIPQPDESIASIKGFTKATTKLCNQIVDHCQREENVRVQAHERICENKNIPDSLKDQIRLSLDYFLDGIGRSTTLDLGILAFYKCWGLDKNDTTNWNNLTARLLSSIFNVDEKEKVDISFDISCKRAVISNDKKNIATFMGEKINFELKYKIPKDQFSNNDWNVSLYSRQRKIYSSANFVSEEGRLYFDINTDTFLKYSKKIPLRIRVQSSNINGAEARLNLFICGEERPAFSVINDSLDGKFLDVVDAKGENDEDTKLVISEPIYIYLFTYDNSPVTIQDENENKSEQILDVNGSGIYRSSYPLDIGTEPNGMATRVCNFGSRSNTICFEANNIEKGAFTLEDELRISIAKANGTLVNRLFAIFNGDNFEIYPKLGMLDDASRRRIFISKLVSNPNGWRPLLADLIHPCSQKSGQLGEYINYLGDVLGDSFSGLALPNDISSLLNEYSKVREEIILCIESRYSENKDKYEHPSYAILPLFRKDSFEKVSILISRYLAVYNELLNYIIIHQKSLDWSQIFVLTHLDCVVHWDKSRINGFFYLITPWHPLVIAKRFMIQSSLFLRASRFLKEENGREFSNLTYLLGSVQGFRWLLSMATNDKTIEPAYISITSDPGWHVGIKTDVFSKSSSCINAHDISQCLNNYFGLRISIGSQNDNAIASTSIVNFQKSYPSRRSIGIRIRNGYNIIDILNSINNLIHSEVDIPEDLGQQLPGGVRLYLEQPLDHLVDNVKFDAPPLLIFYYKDDADCIKSGHPDIYLLSPANDLAFKDNSKALELPRGTGMEAVYSRKLNWLTEGNSQVPISVVYECDSEGNASRGLGEVYLSVLGQIFNILGHSISTVVDLSLPMHLDSPWVVVPGSTLDPAIFAKYVRDGIERGIQDRALWDYKLNITDSEHSYFVLSTIPKGFQIAINGFFGQENLAKDFLLELGQIGIAIGGEALRSGRQAHGVIGLVGAVRLLTGAALNGRSPLSGSANTVGILLPVDSFASFFSNNNNSNESGKRADLLAIKLILPNDDSGKLGISAIAIESKLVTGTYSRSRAHEALGQAKATSNMFKMLVITSLSHSAIPERLALLEILSFGLRISCPHKVEDIDSWLGKESQIYRKILMGDYEFIDCAIDALLVSSEYSFLGAAEHNELAEGHWVRLTKSHWPGVYDTPKLNDIRIELYNLINSKTGVETSTEDTSSNNGNEEFMNTTETSDENEQLTATSEDDTSGGESEVNQESIANGEETTGKLDINHDSTEMVDIGKGMENVKNLESHEHDPFFKKIFIGVDDARRAIFFDPKSIIDPLENLNVMVTGSSGMGKTQFLKYIICKIREQGKNVLLIDMKNDFASDETFCTMAQLERVYVTFNGLPYNPLIPYPIPHPQTGELYLQCAQYIAGIASILKKTYQLGAQQQADVKNAIISAFSAANIPTSGNTLYSDKLKFPDFSSVGESLKINNQAAYNRLDPLFTLDLFRCEYRDYSFNGLVGRSVVLDFSQIPSDEIKNTLAQLVVLSSHSYYNAQPHSGSIRQFLVFDEGHRVLSSDFMLKLVRECRAYGVGTILSSQYPSDFPAEISASMATKIIYGNGRDADRVKSITQLLGCSGRDADISNLGRFQAFMDNSHYHHIMLRTMNYPLYLVWKYLEHIGTASISDLTHVPGIDTAKLSLNNLIRQLESLGLAEEINGRVNILRQIVD